jgi:gluconolactonase
MNLDSAYENCLEYLMNLITKGLLATCLLSAFACESNQTPVTVAESLPVGTAVADAGPAAGTIVGLDPRFDALLQSGATIERVATGFGFIEGPVWMPGEPGRLLFSDIPANTVYQWSADSGAEVFLSPVLADDAQTGGNGGSNGLALDPAGNLILCEHGNRRVARMDENGLRSTLADSYDGHRLNSPNDIVYHASGAAFFTDPPYGL